MKAVITGLMLMCLAMPISAQDAQVDQPQQKSLDSLLSDIQQKRVEQQAVQTVSPEEQVRYLRNQLIDARVERDLLEQQNAFLRRELDEARNEKAASKSVECPPGECLSLAEVEEQILTQHIAHSLSLYRLAEYMHSLIPEEDVEAQARLHKIMDNAKADLELMGFDTTKPENFPTLEELMEHFEVSHQAHRSAP
jgi:septal ring factor EnvC (AmiA/AmiB activator)